MDLDTCGRRRHPPDTILLGITIPDATGKCRTRFCIGRRTEVIKRAEISLMHSAN